MTVPAETQYVYEPAIGIGGTWTSAPVNDFMEAGDFIATVVLGADEKPAGVKIESSEFVLSMVKACTVSVYANTSE